MGDIRESIRVRWSREMGGEWMGQYTLGTERPNILFCVISRPGGRGRDWASKYLATPIVVALPSLREGKAWAMRMLRADLLHRESKA